MANGLTNLLLGLGSAATRQRDIQQQQQQQKQQQLTNLLRVIKAGFVPTKEKGETAFEFGGQMFKKVPETLTLQQQIQNDLAEKKYELDVQKFNLSEGKEKRLSEFYSRAKVDPLQEQALSLATVVMRQNPISLALDPNAYASSLLDLADAIEKNLRKGGGAGGATQPVNQANPLQLNLGQ